MNENKKTLNQSLIYAIAIFMQHVTSIVMLPIYTRYLTPEDYGIADLLAMGVEIIGLVVGVISGEAIFRFYFDKPNEKYKRSVIFTIFITTLCLNFFGYFAIALASNYAAGYLFEGTSVINGQRLVLLYGATIVFQVMDTIPMAYVRVQQKPVLFVFFSALRLILAISCNLYFVVYKELHIEGVVYAVFTFTLLHSLTVTIYMLLRTRIAFSIDIAKRSITFSWPLMFSAMALFLTTYADRLFIKYYADLSEVGIYSLAYKFGFILIAFSWTPFAQAWDVRRYEVVKQDNAIEVFQSTFRITQIFVLFCALGLAVFAQDLLRIMAAPAFHEAYSLVGIIVFAHIFNIWLHYCIFGIFYSQNTVYKAYADWIALPFTILCYFLLIPDYGASGAAWATVLSLGFRFVLVNYWATRFYDMHLEWWKIARSVIVALSLYGISLAFQLPILFSILVNSLLMLIFIAYIFLGSALTEEDKQTIVEQVDNVMRKLKLRQA